MNYDSTTDMMSTMKVRREETTILVWHWQDAPDNYKALSTSGGDEDWVAFVPVALAGTYIPWLEGGGPFGCCSVSEHAIETTNGVRKGTVYIGAHA